MTYVLAVLGCALLFALFGVLRRNRGEGCSSCSTPCPTKETRHAPR